MLRIKGADLEDKFLFQILAAFRRTPMQGKAADSHALFWSGQGDQNDKRPA